MHKSIIGIVLALAGSAAAQSLSTGFTGTTGYTNAGAGNYFTVTSLDPGGISITHFDVHSFASAGTATTVQIYYKPGGYEGFEADQTAWTLMGTYPTVAAGPGQPTYADIGGLHIPGGQTYALRVSFSNGGIRYNSAQTMTAVTANEHLSIFSGTAQQNFFSGILAVPRGWNGTIYYQPGGAPCYANCDTSTVPPILNVEDFTCFINEFAAGQGLPHEQQLTHYANCDQSTTAPVLNVEDFTCFINKFAQGCR
jgi:hypothetical protein